MSVSKKDQLWHPALTDKELASLIQKILRHEYRNQRGAVKRIGKATGIELRAIRNWYDGRNPPNAMHLLLLATYYPDILRLVLKHVGRTELWMAYQRTRYVAHTDAPDGRYAPSEQVYSARYCTINVTLDIDCAAKLNERQLWFLGALQQGHRIRAREIMTVWNVSARAARYDVAELTSLDLIRFMGARKTGYYEAT